MALRFAKIGFYTIVANLDCDELDNLKSYKMVEIHDKAADKETKFGLLTLSTRCMMLEFLKHSKSDDVLYCIILTFFMLQ